MQRTAENTAVTPVISVIALERGNRMTNEQYRSLRIFNYPDAFEKGFLKLQ
jgi:hypothetical protein